MVYDYLLFGVSLLLFLLFIVLGIFFRNQIKMAIFLILLAFATIVLGPTYGYIKMHEFLFANEVQLIEQKKLHFVAAVVLKAKLRNLSKRHFQRCKITASVYKITQNRYKNMILKLKPFKKMSIFEESIDANETREFKLIIEPFRYSGDYNISLKADCR